MKARQLAEMLEKRGFNAFFVGGYVRDMFLGVTAQDVDLATNATPEQVEAIFRPNHRVKTVGKAFGVVLVDGVEIATFRTDNYVGFDHKAVLVKYADTIEEDLSRRDFTFNAMAMDLQGNIVDPFGGREDLEARTVRFVGNPVDRITEDPNRMLRACRFVAQLGFPANLESKTFFAIAQNRNLLKFVSSERIRLEVLKAMKCRFASRFFYVMYETGLLDDVFPSLSACVYHDGGNYHPEDVFTHSMLTGDRISTACPLTKLAGYLHDVGKPITYDEDGRFLDHEKVGAKTVRREMRSLMFSNEEIRVVSGLVEMHMRTATVLTDKGVRRLLRKLTDKGVHYRDYLRLFLADRNSNTGIAKMTSQEVRHMVNTVEEQMSVAMGVTKVTDLAVNGHDVMRVTGLKPGREVGELLEILLEGVLLAPETNNRDYLENLLKTY